MSDPLSSENNSSNETPRETYARVLETPKPYAIGSAYSIYSTNFGMDLAWNYIPGDLNQYVTVNDDYRLNTGKHCNNFLDLGFTSGLIVRDLFTVIYIDDMVMNITGDPGTYHSDTYYSLSVNCIYSFIELFDESNTSVWSYKPAPQSHTNPVDVLAVHMRPTTFIMYLPYTVDMITNSVIDFDKFLSDKVYRAYINAESYQILHGPGQDSGGEPYSLLKGIFSYPFESVTNLSSTSSVRNNIGKLKQFIGPLTVSNIYDIAFYFSSSFIKSGVWLMHRLTFKAIMQLPDFYDRGIDSNGNCTLLGKPVYFSYMSPPSATDAVTNFILFGDLKQAYALIDYGPMESRDLTHDESLHRVTTYADSGYYYHNSRIMFRAFKKKIAFMFKNENAVILWSQSDPTPPPPPPPAPLTEVNISNDNSSRNRSRHQ